MRSIGPKARLLCGAIVGVVFWYSPYSPVALQLEDARLGSSGYNTSTVAYEDIARTHWSASIRSQALRRASQLHEIEGASEKPFFRLYEIAETDEQRADIESIIGFFYMDRGDYSKGASWLSKAQETAPKAAEAGIRLLSAARGYEKAQQLPKAERSYIRLGRKYREHTAQADIGLAELLLSTGKARSARRYFERAYRHAETSDLKALAQFGIATCLERMGNLEEALVEIDTVDLPTRVLDERRDGIRAHQVSEIGGM